MERRTYELVVKTLFATYSGQGWIQRLALGNLEKISYLK